MKRTEVREMLISLSRSQGFYGRLLHQLDTADKDTQDEFYKYACKFEKPVDLIMDIEG